MSGKAKFHSSREGKGHVCGGVEGTGGTGGIDGIDGMDGIRGIGRYRRCREV
jgi:hypothetical protein